MMLIVVGFVSGLISGMGIGGGTILIPALTIFVGISQHEAQGINLLYFIPTAIAALMIHYKNNNIKKEILLYIIGAGIVGALIGSLIAVALEGAILKKIFAGFLLIMGITEFFKKEKRK